MTKEKKKTKSRWVFSFMKLNVIVFVGISLAVMGGKFLIDNQVNLNGIINFTQKSWIITNIASYTLYAVISFILLPILLNKRLVKKDEKVAKWMTKKKMRMICLASFVFFIIFDLLTVQLPYYMILGA